MVRIYFRIILKADFFSAELAFFFRLNYLRFGEITFFLAGFLLEFHSGIFFFFCDFLGVNGLFKLILIDFLGEIFLATLCGFLNLILFEIFFYNFVILWTLWFFWIGFSLSCSKRWSFELFCSMIYFNCWFFSIINPNC